MAMKVLDERRVKIVVTLCELMVPGSGRVGPEVYIDAVLAAAQQDQREAALKAVDALADAHNAQALAVHANTPGFALVRALAVEAFYSDFVAPGRAGPNAWAEIDFQPPRAADLERDWSYLGIQ